MDTVELDPPRSRHLHLDVIRCDYEHLRHDNDHVKTIESRQVRMHYSHFRDTGFS
ncbi:hypothetical protein KIN20_019274 [Parelaphostrongylus tenuis]|uniref:Uncharacterized protein n=1 Tax=Parelaphostrongylus tenuis TaxID=148309 RepID=A0AAD5MRC0_PARTN|nr:hypothetical protein KIN20_019274 [Parelaphostrongylus tenuis]